MKGPPHVRFKGEEYDLCSLDCGRSGNLYLPGGYTEGSVSYARVTDDGRILRFGVQVGTRSDLEWPDGEPADADWPEDQ